MKKRVLIILIAILFLWVIIGTIDYWRVTSFEEPFFCLSRSSVYHGAEDYRHCQGLGYSFEITVNSQPNAEYPGVTRYTYFLFGNEVHSGIRE